MERQNYKDRDGRDEDSDRDTRSGSLYDWESNRDASGNAYGGYPESGFGPRDERRYGGYDRPRGTDRERIERMRRYGTDRTDGREDRWDREQRGYAGYGFGERYEGDYDYHGGKQRPRGDRRDDHERVPFWLTGSYADLYGWPTALPYAAADFGRSTYRRDYPHGRQRHERGFLDRAGDEVRSWFGDEDAQRRREADHRGRGPSDYIRSDDRIREDINDRLTEDSWIDASGVSVAVSGGEVTLGGQVDSKTAKRRAEDIADDVTGVKHVQNNLRIDASFVPQGS